MGRYVGPSNTTHLMRASDPNRGPWLTLNAWPLVAYRKALRALGLPNTSRLTKVEARNALLKFPKDDVLALLPNRELTDEDREAAHERLRRAGYL